MHTLGIQHNKVYFSNGDLTEGFMVVTYPKPLEPNSSQYGEGKESGWFEFKGKLLQSFKSSLDTGIYKAVELTDDEGITRKFSIEDVKFLQRKYFEYYLERISDCNERERHKIIKSIGVDKLSKIAGLK